MSAGWMEGQMDISLLLSSEASISVKLSMFDVGDVNDVGVDCGAGG